MSEANKSLMLSEAEIIEAINSDSLISVSLGAGQPQKNVKMSTLATVAAGIVHKKAVFTTTTTAKVFEITVENSNVGDYVDINIDASGGALSIFRALLTHEGDSFYLGRLSPDGASSGLAYYKTANGNRTFYLKVAAWGRGTIEYKNHLKVNVVDVTGSFNESGYSQV